MHIVQKSGRRSSPVWGQYSFGHIYDPVEEPVVFSVSEQLAWGIRRLEHGLNGIGPLRLATSSPSQQSVDQNGSTPCRMTLIAPVCTAQPWFSQLLSLLVEEPDRDWNWQCGIRSRKYIFFHVLRLSVNPYEAVAFHNGERERNVLFNDALNTFYLRLYGVRHMVKDHSDSEKGNPLPPHRQLLSINSKGYFICTIPQTG